MNHPNILIITTDQMRADCMGCAGNSVIQTPNLDRLADGGAVFDRAYCTNPVCTPSRAAIFTGRYPHVTGAWNIGVSLNEDEHTFCDHLKPLGYQCVANGKMHFRPQRAPEGGNDDAANRDRPRADGTFYGFDEHHITEDNQVGEYLTWLADVAPEYLNNTRGKTDATQGDTWDASGSCLPPEYHQTHWIAERSIETIQAHDSKRPLFMWTSFVDPHHPFNAPARYAQIYADAELPPAIAPDETHEGRPEHLRQQGDRGYWPGGGQEHDRDEASLRNARINYYGMITFIDEQIGRILDALDKRGMRENTLIVFTTDHGELLGDHGLMYKGPWLYDSLARVPMLMNGPGIAAGARVRGLMENVDILPTFLDAIGVEIPYGVQGVSQLPAIGGEQAAVRDSAICSYDAHDRGIRLKMFRTDRYKLNIWAGEDYGELFDLEADPGETENRFFDPDYAAVKAELYVALAHRLIQDEDPLPERLAPW